MIGAGRSSIRPARSDDAAFVARIVLAAQRGPQPRGWFDIALDRPEPECLAFMARLAVARVRSWYHFAHFLIADVDGVPTAALCAMPASGTVVAARAAIEEVAAETGMDADAIVARGSYARHCWVQGGEGDWLIEHVARQASGRSLGLVQALIGRALADGKAAGFARASISFLIGNDAAEHCYGRAGFAFAEEKRDAAFEALTGAPGFRRFARAI